MAAWPIDRRQRWPLCDDAPPMTYPWPPSIQLGPLQLHVFGLMVGLAFVLGYESLRRIVRASGHPQEFASTMFIAACLSGIVGSKLMYLVFHPPHSIGDVFSGNGFTWYGGLLGGALAIGVVRLRSKVPFTTMADLCSLPLLIGLAFGRLGCLLSADGDYGHPTSVPWAVAWPEGLVPTTVGSMNSYFGTNYSGAADRVLFVHPAPIYESIPLLLGALVLWRFRERLLVRPGMMFGCYAIIAGAIRFGVEFVRFNDTVAAGLTLAQLISVVLMLIGVSMVIRASRHVPPAPI